MQSPVAIVTRELYGCRRYATVAKWQPARRNEDIRVVEHKATWLALSSWPARF